MVLRRWHPIRLFVFQAYILQLENYQLKRYLTTIWRLWYRGLYFPPPPPWRQKARWTYKLIAIGNLALALGLLVELLWLFFKWPLWLAVITPIVFSGVPFILLSAATFILWPLDWLVKQMVIARAKRKLKQCPHLKIIGLAGSYGKTTTKEMVAGALQAKFRILKTSANINTPLGIAHLILKNLTPDTEIFIVEMGEYYPGDIKAICALTPPDIAVITGVNEAHLERFKALDKTAATIFEIATFAKPGAKMILNADDATVKRWSEKLGLSSKALFYSARHHPACPYRWEAPQWGDMGTGQTAELWKNSTRLGEVKTQLLGQYALGSIAAAFLVSQNLGVSFTDAKQGIEAVTPIPHRLQPIPSQSGVLVIDDSYNGNPAGVREAIAVLARFTSRRKIFITPGLVEMGSSAPAVHRRLGQELASAANLIILIKNSVTPYLAEGLKSVGFPAEQIIYFFSSPEAHAALPDLVKPGDVVLFQNDWPDNYA